MGTVYVPGRFNFHFVCFSYVFVILLSYPLYAAMK